MVNRVNAKPLSNNYEGDVLVNNLLERYSSCKKLKRYCMDYSERAIRKCTLQSSEVDNNVKSDKTK